MFVESDVWAATPQRVQYSILGNAGSAQEVGHFGTGNIAPAGGASAEAADSTNDTSERSGLAP